ncbi:MAG TPA: tetratricopeptide repeat protein, partial [Catalimonadaceae bacterium]|nr:tetratricopeptide repeat protein [Catalimonadaceae bacterium]
FTRYSINTWKSLGDIYLEQKNTAKARKAFETCLKLTEEAKDTGDMAHCISGLGLCFEREGDRISAEYYFHKGSELARKSGIVRDILRLTNLEADFLCRKGDFEAAQDILTQSLPMAKKEGLKLYLSEIYRMQALILKHKSNNPQAANAYFERYAALKDSIYEDDLPRQFAEQQTRFETERKEAELRLSKQREEIAKLELNTQTLKLQQRNLALGLSVFAFFSISLAGYFYFRKQKADARERERLATQKAEEAERIRLAKDIHDEFGSGLTKIRFVAEMAIEKAGENAEWATLLAPISKTATHLVDNMRDLIWVLHPTNNSLEILVSRIREYANEYLEDLGIEPRFEIPDHIPDVVLTKEAHRNLLMVVKECLQ